MALSLRQTCTYFAYTVGIAAGIIGSIWFYLHRSDPDIQNVAVHVAVDALPFLAAILFGLWPEVSKVHLGWRVTIVAVGLLWTCLLARKDYLDMRTSKNDLQRAVTSAVKQANDHTDTKIDTATKQTEDEIKGLQSSLGAGFNELKPAPPQYAKLQFSLFDPLRMPLSEESLSSDLDGNFTVDFAAKNISSVEARDIDLWLQICDACTFVKEPEGFDHPAGSIATERHRWISTINPGAAVKMTVDFKSLRDFRSIIMSLKYSCGTCGTLAPSQNLTIDVQRVHVPKVRLFPPNADKFN